MRTSWFVPALLLATLAAAHAGPNTHVRAERTERMSVPPVATPVPDESQQRRAAVRAALQEQRGQKAGSNADDATWERRQRTPQERQELRQELRQQMRQQRS